MVNAVLDHNIDHDDMEYTCHDNDLCVEDNIGDKTEVATTFSDLKNIGEIKFSMTQKQTINGQPYRELKFKTVEVNVPIDEKIFEKL